MTASLDERRRHRHGRAIAIVVNQQRDALQSNGAASDVGLVRFDLRTIRAMQSSARLRHDG